MTFLRVDHREPDPFINSTVFSSQIFEAYYNVKCNSFEVQNGKLKVGRFLLSKQTSFLNMSSSLIEMFKPFMNSNESVFPYTPFTMTTWRQLRRNYSISILNKTPLERHSLTFSIYTNKRDSS